uniref:hypothetical protein n=1 Tax=Porodaedalea mongolica TaxID=2651638 RepID=UPI0021AC6F33|nr:hypothetical protein NYK79_mgp41 [Porodaedalea mongolica]UUA03949.1 hypothetical protein [Porodaedalea mongolica]WCF76709.1 hypothetical protein [Porodaedalea mongolica]
MLTIIIPIVGSIFSLSDYLTVPSYETLATIIFIMAGQKGKGSKFLSRMASTKTAKVDKKSKTTTNNPTQPKVTKTTKGDNNVGKTSLFNSLLSKSSNITNSLKDNLKTSQTVSSYRSLSKTYNTFKTNFKNLIWSVVVFLRLDSYFTPTVIKALLFLGVTFKWAMRSFTLFNFLLVVWIFYFNTPIHISSVNLGELTTTFTNSSITNTSITNVSIPNSYLFPQPGSSTSNVCSMFSSAPIKGNGIQNFELTQISLSINSPLESTDQLLLEIKETITTILNYDFILHLIMIYLICMLAFIFTMKIIGDKNLYTPHLEDKIRSLPLGKQINFIISNLISSWQHTNIFWIYFIIFFLFIFMCASTFGVFTCLFVLN